MKKRTYVLLTLATIALLALPVAAQVPNLLNYQGRLTDPSGNPKNGTFSMQFGVYDAETGGNQLPSGSPWNETQSVTVTNGVFNVLLGSVTALPTNLFTGGGHRIRRGHCGSCKSWSAERYCRHGGGLSVPLTQ